MADETTTAPEVTPTQEPDNASEENAELAKLRQEISRQKAALDKATKEAAEAKRALRSKQTEEEAAAAEAKELAEQRDRELAELRKQVAVAATSRKLMGFVGDEATANSIAEKMSGAEDIDGIIEAINKAWTAKEKALRLEYGKIPAPGVGSSDGVTYTREQVDAMSFADRVKYATEHPDDYARIMGRKQ